MYTVAIVNEKGGTGKTTTAVSLSAALGEMGHKVLLVDLDGQAASSRWLGVEEDTSFADALYAGKGLRPRMDVLPNVALAPASGKLDAVAHDLRPTQGGQLRRLLSDLSGQFEFVIIDCPPSLGNRLIGNALLAATHAIVPVETSILALDGLKILLTTLEDVRAGFGHEIVLAGVVACRFDSRTKLSRLVLSELKRALPGQVFETVIRENVRLRECPASGQSILAYAPDSHAAEDYRALARELVASPRLKATPSDQARWAQEAAALASDSAVQIGDMVRQSVRGAAVSEPVNVPPKPSPADAEQDPIRLLEEAKKRLSSEERGNGTAPAAPQEAPPAVGDDDEAELAPQPSIQSEPTAASPGPDAISRQVEAEVKALMSDFPHAPPTQPEEGQDAARTQDVQVKPDVILHGQASSSEQDKTKTAASEPAPAGDESAPVRPAAQAAPDAPQEQDTPETHGPDAHDAPAQPATQQLKDWLDLVNGASQDEQSSPAPAITSVPAPAPAPSEPATVAAETPAQDVAASQDNSKPAADDDPFGEVLDPWSQDTRKSDAAAPQHADCPNLRQVVQAMEWRDTKPRSGAAQQKTAKAGFFGRLFSKSGR